MSDFFENQVNEEETVAEESSIFSEPAQHRKIKQRKKHRWPIILLGIFVIGDLVGVTGWVIKNFEVMDEANANSVVSEDKSIPQNEGGLKVDENGQLQTFEVKNISTDEIASVTVTNTHGVLEIYSKTVDNEGIKTTKWYLKSIDIELLNESFLEEVVEAACQIESTRKITKKTAEECGFKNSKIKAVVTTKKGGKYTVYIGDKSPDSMGYYLMINDENNIYLVDENVQNVLNYSELQLASLEYIPSASDEEGKYTEYFTDGQLTQFDRLTVNGDNYPEGMEIVLNDSDEEITQYLGYNVVKPQERIAQNVEKLMALYQTGIPVVGAYSYDKSAATLAKYGLDKPDFETTVYIKDMTVTYKFALQEDGYYAAVGNNSKLVHRVEASALEEVIDLSTEDYYAGWIFMISIDALESVTVKIPEKTYTFSVKKNDLPEDAPDDAEGYTVKIGGKKLQAQSFQNLYQYMISINLRDFTVNKASDESGLVWEFRLNTGKTTVVEFKKYSATMYQCVVDGKVRGKVNASAIDKAIKYTKKVAAGENIGEIT